MSKITPTSLLPYTGDPFTQDSDVKVDHITEALDLSIRKSDGENVSDALGVIAASAGYKNYIKTPYPLPVLITNTGYEPLATTSPPATHISSIQSAWKNRNN